MSANQLFIIALLMQMGPYVGPALTIVAGIVAFRRQNKKIDATHAAATQAVVASNLAADKSERAETAANHSKEVVSAMQGNFAAVIKVIAPEAAANLATSLPAPSNTPPAQLAVNTDAPPVAEKKP